MSYILFYFTALKNNNSTITILKCMNVDGAFILAETRRKTSVLLFVDNSMQIFFGYISLRIWEDVCHMYHIVTRLQKNYKNEQMMSNGVSAQNFLAL